MGRAYQNRKDSMAKTSDAMAKVYSKYGREIYVVAKAGGIDPDGNLALRGLIDKAKKDQVPSHVIEKAIDEGLVAIGSIIKKMEAAISVPNKLAGSMFKNVFEVHPSKIGLIIGKAGATIKSICEKFSVKINIEDSGEVSVLSLLEENVEAAVSHIQEIIKSKPNRKS